MPLLKRRAWERGGGGTAAGAGAAGFLRDDEEVFHCVLTDEIFRDYEEYCERIILVNSMVWSCEMTGKHNLTYAEALDSEKNARRSLRDFPMELRIPILFLATRTKRSSLNDMLEDVFSYVRERYFIGETVEACLEGDSWSEAHILSVTAPKELPIGGDSLIKPASIYSYEVEQFNQDDATAAGQMGTVPYDRVRRRKGIFSREKNKLFLKQFIEQTPSGIFVIKQSALNKYNISKVKFDQLFTGPPPEFPSSKKYIKHSVSPNQKPSSASKLSKLKKAINSPDRKGRQESIAKYMTKTDKFEGTKQSKSMELKYSKLDPKSANAGNLKDEMKRVGDTMKQRKLEEKARKKEHSAKLAAYVKEWHRQKDDLELEDHKILPKGTPVDIEGIPNKYFGDFLSVLEFVHLYADTLKTKDVFHSGLDIELLKKALTQKEHAGMFSDIVQMMLTTIFTLQEDEAEEVNESRGIQESMGNMDMQASSGITKAVELATKASKWPQTYLGTPLSKLTLDAYTVSEVLRLHLLSSGAAAGDRCARWRYQQRGGYSSRDDAGIHLRLAHPQLIRNLHTSHVGDLELDDKFKILQCLMNQILSYATVRDIIEEKLETLRQAKYELKTSQVAERKREAELMAARIKLKKEARLQAEAEQPTAERSQLLGEELQRGLEALEREAAERKADYERRMKELQAQCFDYQSYLGMDRAYRAYCLNQAVPGLFVELREMHGGACLERPVLPVSLPQDTLQYVQKLFENERGASDKENDSANTSRTSSPKKQPNLNGLSLKLSAMEGNVQLMRDLLVCTGSNATCPVHGSSQGRPRWWVYHTEAEIDELVAALNVRGIREADLKQNIDADKKSIVEYIQKCPLHLLNKDIEIPPPQPNTRVKKPPPSSITLPADSTLSEALELSLRDYILELEEKVFHGCLGSLKVKDREAWRGTILLKSYDKQAAYLTWGPNGQFRDDYHLPGGKTRQLPIKMEDEEEGPKVLPVNNYRDPGQYLDASGSSSWSSLAHCEEIKLNGGLKAALEDVTLINGGIKNALSPLNGGTKMPSRIDEVKLMLGVKTEPSEAEEEQQRTVRGLASALLQISQAIQHKYLKRPLGYDDKERKDREAKNKSLEFDALYRWETSLMECRSLAQVSLHLATLDSSVTWTASILNASCRLCRRKTDGDNMLLCDGCNKGHHMYCLKPKLIKVPAGDWYCDVCKPKEKTPRKKRKLFVNEDIHEETEDDADESMEAEGADGLCSQCGSGGRLSAVCAVCRGAWHSECAQPRPPRNHSKPWKCAACIITNRRENTGTRRCAADAMNNIHQYARVLCNSRLSSTDSENSEDNVVLLKYKTRKPVASMEASPVANGHRTSGSSRRSRKSQEEVPGRKRTSGASTPVGNGESSNSRRSKKSVDEAASVPSRRSKSSAPTTPVLNGVHDGGSKRASKSKRSSRASMRTAELEQLLREIIKHRDSWPFCEPVSTDEVHDYLDYVTEPMDYGAISGKLSRGEYASEEGVLRDTALVLHNCALYNPETHIVAKAGVRLEKFISKRLAELDLPALPSIEEEPASAPPKAKRAKIDK